MAIERLPESVRSRSVARAAFSPSAAVAAGAGVGAGLLVGGVLPVVLLGAGFWGIRVAVAAALAGRRRRRAAQPEPIDPYAVPDPWRTYVREALTAQTQFGQAVGRCRPGPLRDRLVEVSVRFDDGVRECWRVAQLGASIAAALAALDRDATSRQLRGLQEERHRQATGVAGPSPGAIDQSEAALAARLQAARRMETVVQRATDRLRVVTAQLDEIVASAVELSLGGSGTDPDAVLPVAGGVDSVVADIESLRRAMEETDGTPTAGTATTS